MNSPQQVLDFFLKTGFKNKITYVDVDGKRDYSIDFKDFIKTVASGANFFYKKLNLKKGETISYVFENSPEIILLNLICFLTGLIACSLDAKRDKEEIALRKLTESKSKVFFYRPSINPSQNSKLKTQNAKKNNSDTNYDLISQIKAKTKIKTFPVADFASLKNLFGKNSNQTVFKNFSPKDVCLILYTSGTTGFPKGALLTFSNLFYGAKQVGEWFKITERDNFYLVLPLHHINSLIFSLATLFTGGSLIISSRYSKSRFFPDAAKYQATLSSIVATINLDLLEEEESFKQVAKSLKFKRIQIGSAPVSPKHTAEFTAKYGIRLIQGYGSTETSLRATGVPVEANNKLYQYLLKTNSIGEALSQNQVFLIDGAGKIIEQEKQSGEICVRGKNIMRGYLNREKESKEALANGSFHMGDLGYFEKIAGKKFYFLKGRIKELIIKGGVNISPIFIEEKLRQAFTFARDVVVIGFPHFRLGEEIGAIFIPKNQDYEKDFARAKILMRQNKVKNLSAYETPQAALIANYEDIAKTATGKVQHVKVREDFKNKLADGYRLIGQNKKYVYRLITPEQNRLLTESVKIHNQAFPKSLSLDLPTLIHRATNGFVIGGFEKEKIVGVLSGFFVKEEVLKKENLWNKITGQGKFTSANAHGNIALLCSAASQTSQGKITENIKVDKSRFNLSELKIKNYIKEAKDYVIRFHNKPKAGFTSGARVYRIIPKGNLPDQESLGAVIMLVYPELKNLADPIFTEDKIGIGLVEAAIKYAKQNNKEKVIALSRLGEGYKYL